MSDIDDLKILSIFVSKHDVNIYALHHYISVNLKAAINWDRVYKHVCPIFDLLVQLHEQNHLPYFRYALEATDNPEALKILHSDPFFRFFALEQPNDFWFTYFTAFWKTPVGKSYPHIREILRNVNEKSITLEIYQRLMKVYNENGGYYHVYALMTKYPYTAPFVHGCIELFDIDRQWHKKDAVKLMHTAHTAIILNNPLAKLVYHPDKSLVTIIDENAQLKECLLQNMSYWANKPPKSSLARDIVQQYDSNELDGKITFIHLINNMLDAETRQCMNIWYKDAASIVEAFRKQFPEEIAGRRRNWIDDFITTIDITAAQMDILGEFICNQEIDEAYACDVTEPDLVRLTALPLGAIKKIIRAWRKKEY